MSNTDIIKATKEIVIAMISNQNTEKSADEVAKSMDIIYSELEKLVKDNPHTIYGKSPSEN
jgi:hypothetical protein